MQALGAQAPLLDVAENSQRAAPHEACGAQIRGRVQLKVQRVLRVWNDFPLAASSRPNVLEGLIALSCTGSGVQNKQTCIHSGLTPKSKGPKSCAKHMSSKHIFTKASEASWSYSCDSQVSFDRVQILTPDFSGRRPPHPPPSLSPPPLSSSLSPCLPPTFPPSSLFGMWLALRILRPHSLTLTLTLTLTVSLSLSHPHCLSHLSLSSLSHLSLNSLSSLSHLSLISLISPSSLSHLSHISLSSLSLPSLSLSLLSVSRLSVSLLSSLAGGPGQRTTYKGLFTPASKKSAVFFPTSLPSTFPFWSASFRPPPLGLKCFWFWWLAPDPEGKGAGHHMSVEHCPPPFCPIGAHHGNWLTFTRTPPRTSSHQPSAQPAHSRRGRPSGHSILELPNFITKICFKKKQFHFGVGSSSKPLQFEAASSKTKLPAPD